ncbi:MAG: tetratricopeptide repeat protein [Planctomycetes bacterium]|nr:tetratricopeptide repeat protein [Planctomycetota bacterium]
MALCLAVLFLSSAWQLVPLSRGLLGFLSPATAQWYQQLLPEQAEQLPAGFSGNTMSSPVKWRISLYPEATRGQVLLWFACFLLFGLVRNNLPPVGGWRRLSAVILGNATLLALVGWVPAWPWLHRWTFWEHLTADGSSGLWAHPDQLPLYLNLGVGLAAGWLLSRWTHWTGKASDVPSLSPGRKFLLDGRVWVAGLILLLLLGRVAFSLSRGGFLALTGASLVWLVIEGCRQGRLLRSGLVFLFLAGVLVLVGGWGWQRLGGEGFLSGNDPSFQLNPLSQWSRSREWVREFPWWGTGLGTAPMLAPVSSTTAVAGGDDHRYLRNSYLEVLVEGGLVRLALCLATLGLVFYLGIKALRHQKGTPLGGWVLGGLFGFTTLVIHSWVDAGFHIPAVALPAIVLCAYLCSLGTQTRREEGNEAPAPQARPGVAFSLRLGGLAAPAATSLALVVGLVLVSQGWKEYRVRRFLEAASRLDLAVDLPTREGQLEYLEAASRLAPGNASLHLKLAQVHGTLFRTQSEDLQRNNRLTQATQAVSGWAGTGAAAEGFQVPWSGAPLWLVLSTAREKLVQEKEEQGRRNHLLPALRHGVQARNVGPLLAGSHLWLAEHTDWFVRAEAPAAYRHRAKEAAPDDPAIWYQCGDLEEAAGQRDLAWQSWRHCLELSHDYLPDILDQSRKSLEPADILQRILPEQPQVLLEAASYLFPHSDQVAERRPFLEKALALVGHPPGPPRPEDLHLKAQIYQSWGQEAEALAAYREALAQKPGQAEWRFDLAEYYSQQERWEEAQGELQHLLEQQPGHRRARHLLEEVTRELAAKS